MNHAVCATFIHIGLDYHFNSSQSKTKTHLQKLLFSKLFKSFNVFVTEIKSFISESYFLAIIAQLTTEPIHSSTPLRQLVISLIWKCEIRCLNLCLPKTSSTLANNYNNAICVLLSPLQVCSAKRQGVSHTSVKV